ncbi:hypothetical protein KK141_10470 [Dyella sp. LX-66]|uniref:hypothetical protein n=1 Tax=unclassified Dyella TaxID=2634549 RepID=UPI001BE0AF28|nr:MULTISPECIES: hypothetical protein [unclassified Dyella]MBT2116966.1 hypothetical protein [Dyella sp. LX-1]MBT2139958.1 hypothetical protein [Dyella sp. LX-66]
MAMHRPAIDRRSYAQIGREKWREQDHGMGQTVARQDGHRIVRCNDVAGHRTRRPRTFAAVSVESEFPVYRAAWRMAPRMGGPAS